MGKVSELSMLVDELKKCGETLIGISEELTELFSSTELEKQPIKKSAAKMKEPEPPAKKELTLEEVRAVLADKSRAGFTEQVKELLKSMVRISFLQLTRQSIKHCLRMRR